ncbi:Zinc finger, C2H2 type family protein [Candida albicans]|uniref:Zinc finger, C2H2 type family protein n=1 Tax=Candida albicans TaxID=5476 RepID=A0A8H6BTX0_CANAX|nr:Zinc finger, C2H2 type family protein [Candida albicans]
MTSLAILPQLKRTITDIMDEELYQSPSSPNSMTSFPSEQLASQDYIDHLKSQQQQEQAFENPDDIYVQDVHENQVNPFNDYGNPDSFIRAQEQQSQLPQPQQPISQQDKQRPQSQQQQATKAPLPQAFPTRRRRKITLLNDIGGSSTRKKHFDEDYLLYNPDISPGHIVTDCSLDSSLVIPPNSNELFLTESESPEFANDIIPGYENDYLFLDDDDEQIEEDVSDDEGDNYFQVDEDFDDYLMNNNGYDGYPTFNNYESSGNNTDIINNNNNIVDETISDANSNSELEVVFDQPKEVSPSAISPASPDSDDMMIDVEDETEIADATAAKEEINKKHSKSGAEITLNNPNHQCNLINPSTGEPCNKQFSRPYDLIRHQDTIHASMKKIFRCVICEGRLNGGPGNGKEKTFSRGDALSRHIKIKHGLVGQDALDLINEAKENVEYIPV